MKIINIDKIVSDYQSGNEWFLEDYPSSYQSTNFADLEEWDVNEVNLQQAKVLANELTDYEFEIEIEEAQDFYELQDALEESPEYKRDNSYNQSWWGGVIDFGLLVEGDYDKALCLVRFHIGGDVRGNYTDIKAFEMDSYLEDFPMWRDRLTYQIETEKGRITLDSDDFEGYSFTVIEDETGTFEEEDYINLGDIEDKFNTDDVDLYNVGGAIAVEQAMQMKKKQQQDYPKTTRAVDDLGQWFLTGRRYAKGGEIASAIFSPNSKRGKISTSFGDKTKEGLTAMIENDSYTPTEIANAVFYENDKNNRIETSYGTKSWSGLLAMIESARDTKMAKGGKLKDWENSMKRRKDIEYLRIERTQALPNGKTMIYYKYNPIGSEEYRGTQVGTDSIYAKGGGIYPQSDVAIQTQFSFDELVKKEFGKNPFYIVGKNVVYAYSTPNGLEEEVVETFREYDSARSVVDRMVEKSKKGKFAKGGSIKKPRLKKGDNIYIDANKWQDVYGNTYHIVQVYVNDDYLGESDYTYGYGNQYEETAKGMIFEKYAPPYGYKDNSLRNPIYMLKEKGINVKSRGEYVNRKKDMRRFAKGGSISDKDQKFYDSVDELIQEYNISEQTAEREAEDILGYKAKYSRSSFAKGGNISYNVDDLLMG